MLFMGGGFCLEGNAVHERVMVSGMLVLSRGGEGVVLSIKGSDIISPPSPVKRQTILKILPCPKLCLLAVNMMQTLMLSVKGP